MFEGAPVKVDGHRVPTLGAAKVTTARWCRVYTIEKPLQDQLPEILELSRIVNGPEKA